MRDADLAGRLVHIEKLAEIRRVSCPSLRDLRIVPTEDDCDIVAFVHRIEPPARIDSEIERPPAHRAEVEVVARVIRVSVTYLAADVFGNSLFIDMAHLAVIAWCVDWLAAPSAFGVVRFQETKGHSAVWTLLHVLLVVLLDEAFAECRACLAAELAGVVEFDLLAGSADGIRDGVHGERRKESLATAEHLHCTHLLPTFPHGVARGN